MKALITGGAGFIGSHLIEELNKHKVQCAVIDDLSKGHKSSLKGLKCDFFRANICDSNLSSLIERIKPDLVIHLAAQTSITLSNEVPKFDLKVNLLGTFNLLNSLKKVRPGKIIFASSGAVYGKSEKFPILEDSPKNPFSIYGISKFSSEIMISNWAKEHSISCTLLRFANVYGEKQESSAEGGVVSIFIRNFIHNQPITIFGDGNQTRDFIYVKDVISAILKSIELGISGTFNVASGRETSVKNLFHLIENISGKKTEIFFRNRNFFEVKRSLLSYSKIQSSAKWKPHTKLEDGLTKAYLYFKSALK